MTFAVGWLGVKQQLSIYGLFFPLLMSTPLSVLGSDWPGPSHDHFLWRIGQLATSGGTHQWGLCSHLKLLKFRYSEVPFSTYFRGLNNFTSCKGHRVFLYIQLSFFPVSCFISVCLFVALLRATYAENVHIVLIKLVYCCSFNVYLALLLF